MNNIINFIKKYKFIIITICLICFIILTKFILEKEILEIDKIIYKFISNNFMNEKMNKIMLFITSFANTIFLITLTICLIILIKNKSIKILIPINLGLIFIINQSLKYIFKRPRPVINTLETGYSFPSGHSAVGLAFYTFLIYLIYKKLKNKKIKILLITLLSILIFLIGISRIYLGVHYASDVIGGFLIGIIYLTLFIKFSSSILNSK